MVKGDTATSQDEACDFPTVDVNRILMKQCIGCNGLFGCYAKQWILEKDTKKRFSTATWNCKLYAISFPLWLHQRYYSNNYKVNNFNFSLVIYPFNVV